MTVQQWEQRLLPSLRPVIDIITERIPYNGILLDIGANVGLVTEEVLKVKPNITSWLFEPVKKYFEVCEEKFKYSSNVRVLNVGLSDTYRTSEMYVDTFNWGYNQITNREGSSRFLPFSAFARAFNIQHVDFIKIDVEGHEVEVLEGMIPYLDHCSIKPDILMETGWDEQREKTITEHLQQRYGYYIKYYQHDLLFTRRP